MKKLVPLRTIVRMHFKGQAPRIWLDIRQNMWRILVINNESKKIIATTHSTINLDDAIKKMKKQISSTLKKRSYKTSV